jgi:hypothetical protein
MFEQRAWNVPQPRKHENIKHENHHVDESLYAGAIEACVGAERKEPLDFKDNQNVGHFVDGDQIEIELNKKRMHSTNDQRKSATLENIVLGLKVGGAQGENAPIQLFGKDAIVSFANKWDDLKGLDGYVIFSALGEDIVLGIDVTMNTGNNREGDFSLETKMANNVSKMDGGGAMLRYFESPATGEVGPKRNVVPVVLGISGHNLSNLIERAGRLAQLEIKHKHRMLSEQGEMELSKRRAGMWKDSYEMETFLQQIKRQLEQYEKRYADGKNPELHENVGKLLQEIKKLIPAKRGINMAGEQQDPISERILHLAKTAI